jgi:hypothetical protein
MLSCFGYEKVYPGPPTAKRHTPDQVRAHRLVISSFENKKSQNKLPSWDPLLRSPVSVMALLVILKVFKAGEAEVVTRCESQLAFLLLHLVWKVLHE